MAASVAYSAEEVERVILALYSGQNVAEADRWLTLFVASPAAWEISLGMISRLPTTCTCPTRSVGSNEYWPNRTGFMGSVASAMYTPLSAAPMYT